MNYRHFHGMAWPCVDEELANLGRRLRYKPQPTDSDLVCAASVIDAYLELVRCTQEKRANVVRELKKNIKDKKK